MVVRDDMRVHWEHAVRSDFRFGNWGPDGEVDRWVVCVGPLIDQVGGGPCCVRLVIDCGEAGC